MDDERRIIETDLGDGRSTYVSYGWSIDYSDVVRRLRKEIENLPELKEARRRRKPGPARARKK